MVTDWAVERSLPNSKHWQCGAQPNRQSGHDGAVTVYCVTLIPISATGCV